MHLIHDVRLVFMFIRACIEDARQRSGARACPDELARASRLVDTGMSLVNELLVDRALTPIAPSVDVNQIVEEFDPVLATIAGPRIGISTKVVHGDTRVHAQRADLERILLNVAFNATTAMTAGGSLLIDTDLVGSDGSSDAPFGYLELTVRDNGCGMSDAQLARAVDPYAAPKPDGSGLGLASVALILTRLGGELAIESEPRKGTTVSILIPLAGAAHPVH